MTPRVAMALTVAATLIALWGLLRLAWDAAGP